MTASQRDGDGDVSGVRVWNMERGHTGDHRWGAALRQACPSGGRDVEAGWLLRRRRRLPAGSALVPGRVPRRPGRATPTSRRSAPFGEATGGPVDGAAGHDMDTTPAVTGACSCLCAAPAAGTATSRPQVRSEPFGPLRGAVTGVTERAAEGPRVPADRHRAHRAEAPNHPPRGRVPWKGVQPVASSRPWEVWQRAPSPPGGVGASLAGQDGRRAWSSRKGSPGEHRACSAGNGERRQRTLARSKALKTSRPRRRDAACNARRAEGPR